MGSACSKPMSSNKVGTIPDFITVPLSTTAEVVEFYVANACRFPIMVQTSRTPIDDVVHRQTETNGLKVEANVNIPCASGKAEYAKNRHESEVVSHLRSSLERRQLAYGVEDKFEANFVTICVVREDRDWEQSVLANMTPQLHTSIIATDNGVQITGKLNSERNWRQAAWITPDGVDHRPREFFVANSYEYRVNVEVDGDKDGVSAVKYGMVVTFKGSKVKVSLPADKEGRVKVVYGGPTKVRVSIIVLSGARYEVTPQLIDDGNFKKNKWVVHGTNYRPNKAKRVWFGLWA